MAILSDEAKYDHDPPVNATSFDKLYREAQNSCNRGGMLEYTPRGGEVTAVIGDDELRETEDCQPDRRGQRQ